MRSYRVTGTVADGGDFELAFVIAAEVTSGRISRVELLPDGEIDEALRRVAI